MLGKVRMGRGNRNSHQVRMKVFPRRHNRPSHSQTWGGLASWRSRTSSRVWHRTRSRRVSEPMRGTAPPMTLADHRHFPHWLPIRRDQAAASMSALSTGAWEVVAAEVVAEEVEPEALAAAVLEAGSR